MICLSDYILKAILHSLLGHLQPNMVAVAVHLEPDETEGRIVFYFNGPVSEEDIDNVEIFETEFHTHDLGSLVLRCESRSVTENSFRTETAETLILLQNRDW